MFIINQTANKTLTFSLFHRCASVIITSLGLPRLESSVFIANGGLAFGRARSCFSFV